MEMKRPATLSLPRVCRSGYNSSHAYGNGHGGDFCRGRTAGRGPAAGVGRNLDLHRGFADVVASLEAGHGGTLGGVWGSSRALVAAALARSCPGPLVVVAPHPGEIDAIARDLALFTDLPVARVSGLGGGAGRAGGA